MRVMCWSVRSGRSGWRAPGRPAAGAVAGTGDAGTAASVMDANELKRLYQQHEDPFPADAE